MMFLWLSHFPRLQELHIFKNINFWHICQYNFFLEIIESQNINLQTKYVYKSVIQHVLVGDKFYIYLIHDHQCLSIWQLTMLTPENAGAFTSLIDLPPIQEVELLHFTDSLRSSQAAAVTGIGCIFLHCRFTLTRH